MCVLAAAAAGVAEPLGYLYRPLTGGRDRGGPWRDRAKTVPVTLFRRPATVEISLWLRQVIAES